jgi:TolB-like protein
MIAVFTRIFAATTVCLAAVLVSLALPLTVQASPESVLVFAFENQTDDRNIDWIGTGLSELVLERLAAERDLYIFNRMNGQLLSNAWEFRNPVQFPVRRH